MLVPCKYLTVDLCSHRMSPDSIPEVYLQISDVLLAIHSSNLQTDGIHIGDFVLRGPRFCPARNAKTHAWANRSAVELSAHAKNTHRRFWRLQKLIIFG